MAEVFLTFHLQICLFFHLHLLLHVFLNVSGHTFLLAAMISNGSKTDEVVTFSNCILSRNKMNS